MKKNSSKKNSFITESKNKINDDKNLKLQEMLLNLEDSDIEILFESGRINQNEYEYILDLRKKKKARKKSQQEIFEERIRCDKYVIDKIINIGRKFRVQDLIAHGKFEEAKKVDVNKNFSDIIEEQEYYIDDRTRDKQKEERLRQKEIERNSKGRGRERDRR